MNISEPVSARVGELRQPAQMCGDGVAVSSSVSTSVTPAPPCCTVDGFDYSTGPMSMTMHSAMQSIGNSSVDLSAQFLAVRAITMRLTQLTVNPGRIRESVQHVPHSVYISVSQMRGG
ncbi:hypothetical protein [Burkholderia anthina]|uniref:hypothetical protein n=1 Tax=Burkholderia anthina TaxID=179879 RepID=UPI0037C0619A